jgi:hypothetical protein
MNSNACADPGGIPSAKYMAWGAFGAFAILAALVYLDVLLDYPETAPLFFAAYWVLMLVTSVCAAFAVTSIRRLLDLGPWRVTIGLVTGLLTFGVSFILLALFQFLVGGK